MLKLDDESFFESHPPLPRAKVLPGIKDAVMAYGYPTGGSSLSITKGIVSRTEFTSYNASVSGLRIQIDAAINPGNSGGPAVVDDRMIGLAFSHLGGSENISYIIPSEEIELFLRDIADGRYDGKPAVYEHLLSLENPAMRAFLKIDKSVHGIVVNKPSSADPAYPLRQWDVITRIGNTPVDDQGMIKVNDNLRVLFGYEVQKIAKDGKVPFTVVRDGRETLVELPVGAKRPLVIPDLGESYPSYFVYGPLVFSEATTEFVRGFTQGNKGAAWMLALSYYGNPLVTRAGDAPAFADERLAVVSCPFFPHKLARGYGNPGAEVVKSVNGVPVKNLRHLVELLRDARDEFIALEFNNRTVATLIFPRKEMIAATDEILTDNGVRRQGSPDTLAVWAAAPSSPPP